MMFLKNIYKKYKKNIYKIKKKKKKKKIYIYIYIYIYIFKNKCYIKKDKKIINC